MNASVCVMKNKLPPTPRKVTGPDAQMGLRSRAGGTDLFPEGSGLESALCRKVQLLKEQVDAAGAMRRPDLQRYLRATQRWCRMRGELSRVLMGTQEPVVSEIGAGEFPILIDQAAREERSAA
jgi:hypothetical protein